LATDVADDDLGLGHGRLELRLGDEALELHCKFGVGFGVLSGRQAGLIEVDVDVKARQAQLRLRIWCDGPVKMQW